MNKHFFLIFGVFGCFSLIHSQSITCSENESFRHCSTCEPSCYNKNPVCTKECKPPRCMCLPNFYRHSNGKCVLETDCPITDSGPDSNSDDNYIVIKCRENEEFTRCPGCEYRCGDTVLPCLPLNCPLNPNRFRGKCQCKRGYLRHDNGSCVLEHQCPNTIDTSGNMCGINEESRPCNTCELTCEDPMGQYCYSKPECVGNTCQCKDGFYRNSVGKCVRRWRCYESGHPRPVTRTNLTCDNVQCDDGYDCVTINPICASLRVPCDTTPKVLCLPRNGTNLPALPLTCSNVRCDPGYHCEMLSRFCPPNNGIKCVGIPRCAEGDALPVTSQTCDNFKCASDEICVMLKQCYSLHISCDVEPKPKCIKQISITTLTCDNFQCGEKETCVMKAPMCPSLRVECDTRPKPQCIPISNLPSCDSFQCETNEQCVMKTPICPSLRANCIKVPQPQCVPLDSNTA